MEGYAAKRPTHFCLMSNRFAAYSPTDVDDAASLLRYP